MNTYEKKYKEALGWMQSVYPTMTGADKEDAEHFFPELKESKDEKIKKVIRGWIYTRPASFFDNGISKEEILSWLEKQGDTIKIKKGKNYLCTKTHKYAGLEWIEGVKYYSPEDYSLINQGCTCYCPKYSKEEHNNFFKEDEYNGCLENQGKLKWTEEDDDNLNMAIYFMRSENTLYSPTDVEPVVEWLCGLKQRIEK